MGAKLGPLMKFASKTPAMGAKRISILPMSCTKKNGWNSARSTMWVVVSISRYREMVESLIAELTEHNPVLQKIKNGETVSTDEANELAELLHEEHPHITENLLRQVYKNRKARFIQFIRHILGIEVLKSFGRSQRCI